MHDSIGRLAVGLISLGVQRGDQVVILLKNSSEFIISFFAITEVGAIAVPLNVHYKEQELTDYIRDSKPKVVIALRQVILLLKEVMSFMNDRECAIIGVPNGKDGPFSYMRLIKEIFPLNRTINLLPDNDLLLQYSSGSTEKPKRIIRTHFNLVSEAENFCSTALI